MTKKLLYLTDRQATWLELFFDLIFVVALGRVTHFLVHVHHGHLSEGIWWKFILVFIPLWWVWVGHTVYSNRFDADTRPHRVICESL
ncbi:MAG: low temperature requirement protein A [Deltaproteobacteria bacterium]|nr:low temperature requirement protein A [Deltaproteobacteria bacterium]